ncbi:MAG TPA: peptidylprolyl isomerase, partial [Puia sp.]
MKNVFLIFLLILCSYSFYGQTLVRFGNQTIPRNEFLAAFHKNNSMVRATDSAYRDYLNLYIRYKLKVQAAYDERLDTMAGQITELQNFKSQIVDQYMQDEASINEMAKEAFTRSQHDLRISCIFVAASKNSSPADTLKAWKKVNAAYSALKNRRDFGEVALQYSEDPFVKENRGDLGYITVFDLPYSIETVAYRTPVAKFSPVFRTGGGYIILKKTAERRAEGRIRIAQILLIFPFNATNADKMNTRLRADSIYHVLKTGADFGALARKFSGDNLSYQLDGVLPEFGIGKYEAGFERAAFNLKKDGEISPVYESSFGFHILKRIARKPVSAVADKKTLEDLKEKIKADPRVAISRQRMLQTILKQTGFREYIPSGNR